MREATKSLLTKVCTAMDQVAAMVREDTNAAEQSKDHVEVIRHYNDLRLAIEQIKTARKAVEGINEQLSREIVPDAMREAKVKTITVEGVGRVTISHRFSCSMTDKERGIQWLKDNQYGEIVQETVNAQTLASHARDLLENHGKELPEDLFKVSTSPYTSITKVK